MVSFLLPSSFVFGGGGEGERGADFLFLWGGSCSKNQAIEYHTKFVQVNPLPVTVSQNS
jgi:hypothetical protein